MHQLYKIVIPLLVLGLSIDGNCYDGGYSPGFEPFAKVSSISLQKCPPIDISSCEKVSFKCPISTNNYSTINIVTDDDANYTEIPILRSAGYSSVAKTDYKHYCSMINEIEVYTADLNRDKIPDIITVLPGSGFGLRSEFCNIVFALSSGANYKFIGMSSMGFGPEDIIDYYRDGRCQIIHTSFIYSGDDLGKDGKSHGYWVYTFFEVDGIEIKLSDKIPRRWIMFAGKSNHKSTQQLSDDQKERLWNKANQSFFWGFNNLQ